jgi:hypothetical protein
MSISRYDITSSDVRLKKYNVVITIRACNSTPMKAAITVMILPVSLAGDSSPYPTEVMVMRTIQHELLKV